MKLKKLINENLWNERKFGEPLPTLEDTSKAYKLKKEQEVKEPVKEVSLTENNLKVRKEALYKINYMLRYSQRLGSDEKSDLKDLAKIVSKIR